MSCRTAVTLFAAMLALGAFPSAQQPRFSSRVDLVVLSAVVRDSQNGMVRGLSQDDFAIIEDGKPVAVSTFAEVNADNLAPQDDGRFIVLLLDDLITHPMFATRIKEVAHAFADRMGRRDVMSVVFLNGGANTATRNATQVHAAIDKFKPFGTPPGSVSGLSMQTVGDLARQLAALPHRRKVLVCVGPAGLFNPALGPGDLQGIMGKSMRDTALANVTTYVIDPLGLEPARKTETRPIEGAPLAPIADPGRNITKGAGVTGTMDGFARETGGAAFANVNIFGPAVEQVWQESGTYYLLGYEAARRDNRRHTIEVRVKKPDMSARARRTR
jgi:VWFA-related protein